MTKEILEGKLCLIQAGDGKRNASSVLALAEEIVNVYQKCPERLKIKRYMTVKREDGAGPSTSAEGQPEELQESSLYNSITASIAAAGRPTAHPAPKVKIEVELPTAQKADVAVEITGASKINHPGNHETSTAQPNSEKKQKAETAKLDVKSYMDRMKDRRPDQQSRNAVSSPSTTRKSFMPDVSMTSREVEDPKRQDFRSADRYGRHRSNYPPEQDARMHSSQRPPGSNSSSSYRHDQRSSSGTTKSEHSRQHSESTGNDNSLGGRKRHNDGDNDYDDRDRKMPKMEFDNRNNRNR